MMNWIERPEFRGIELYDSFVLAWHMDGEQLVFSLEASIWPESPHYEKPKPGEYTCYKKAELRFEGFASVDGLKKMEEVKGHPNPGGTVDYDCVEWLEVTESGFRIEGEFGSVAVSGGAMHFEICDLEA